GSWEYREVKMDFKMGITAWGTYGKMLVRRDSVRLKWTSKWAIRA
ncbi:5170_t:CDS:2, partial [Dentiscutata erythropus]